jgi:RNA polymerase sigma-70 factor (sigma-E family)
VRVDRYAGFLEFVHARAGSLSRTAYLLTGDVHLAEDLLQTALARTAARWPQVLAGGRPEAYVRRALVNEHISWWRRRKGAVEVPSEALPDAGVTDFAGTAVRRIALERALARLTPKQRAVIVLRYYEDLSEAETASLLSCSVGTVKSQTSHALGRLRVLAPDLADLLVDFDDVPVEARP